MKTCRTLNGLLTAIKKGENACLNYCTIFREKGVYEIWLPNNKCLKVDSATYEKIRPYLRYKGE